VVGHQEQYVQNRDALRIAPWDSFREIGGPVRREVKERLALARDI